MEFGILIVATIPFNDPLLIAIVVIRTTGVRIVGLERLILFGHPGGSIPPSSRETVAACRTDITETGSPLFDGQPPAFPHSPVEIEEI